MTITESQRKIFWVFISAIILFIIIFVTQKNFEFISYVAIVLILFFAVLTSIKYVSYPNYVLWGLLVWALLHMLGGVATGDGGVIYTQMLYEIVGEPYSILKYDQVVHAYGFFVATLVMFAILKKYLTVYFGWIAVGIVLTMAGLGLGALNEIVEFIMTILLPNTNVGGYENTALDLVFNLLGAFLAVIFLKSRKLESRTKLT